jgi:hypothetical protein
VAVSVASSDRREALRIEQNVRIAGLGQAGAGAGAQT